MLEGLPTSPGALIESAMRHSGVSLEQLSASTRIRAGLLGLMLEDDFVETGGDVYARGHLRAIAGVLGLDPDQLVAAYDASPQISRPPAP